jgi:hypothetical protein
MINLQLLFAILFIAACSQKEKPALVNETKFRKGIKLAELKVNKLDELSGLAASINNPGLLWTQNDSGNGADIFLIDQKLNLKQTYSLKGIDNRDWEDIAVGPGPDSTRNYIYIAEIGDNNASFRLKYIYRFEEPVWQKEEKKIKITVFDTITFQLPDGIKDLETLMIDPNSKDLIVISKRERPVYVYQIKYPYSIRDTITATKVGPLQLTQITAGDVSADGSEVLLKNYKHIYYWHNTAEIRVVDLLKTAPREIPYELEPQGESIAWARDNSGFYTISEKVQGKKSFLYFYERESD